MKILVTGGSGFLGAAILPYLARDSKISTIFILLRTRDKKHSEERLKEIIDRVFPPFERGMAMEKLRVVPGDLEMKKLGLDEKWTATIRESLTHILHVGASTRFDAPLEESRRINVEGTRELLNFALTCKLKPRFDYVSTAFVAGTKGGVVFEKDLVRDQDFANNYERSKYEAELLVRSYRKQLPIAITRPSIIVGDSRTGFTPHFKVLYWPLQLLARNLIPLIPANRFALLDIVPIDYVAKATYCVLTADDALNRTFYLTAGIGRTVRMGRFLKDVFRYTGIRRRPIIPFWLFEFIRSTYLRRIFNDSFWETAEMAFVYNDYLRGGNAIFDSRESESFLARYGVPPPPNWKDYGEKILSFCITTRWGKKLKASEFMYRNPEYLSGEVG